MQQPQQLHQDGGGSQYGAAQPDMGPFSPPPAAATGPMPLSSRPPSTTQPPPQQQQPRASYEELAAVSGGTGAGGGFDDEMLGGGGGGGGGGSSSGASSNRWPREETQALIRIRSEMDATFRDATLKGPLWEDVSRKLADLGYKRSAKKCKEKFENVHKYYKRTKEGRAGRQDGKSYRFFDELEALHAAAPQPQQQLPTASTAMPLHVFATPVSAPPPMSSMPPPPPGPMQPAPISSAAPAPAPAPVPAEMPPVQQQPLNMQGFSFSSMSDSESDNESEDDDMTAETGGSQDHLGKRKRGGGGGGSKKMMSFFEGLMQQVVERQEEMQRRFMDTMEKREAERTAREEAWRRQEVARLNREQDQLAQERAAAASRDAAIIAFLQRIGGQSVQPPIAVAVPMPIQTPPPPKQPPRQQHQHPPPPSPQATTPQSKPISVAPLQQQPKETPPRDAGTPRSAPPTSGASLELVPLTEQHVDSGLGGGDGGAASSSRWPKIEVNALIQLRMELDMRYQETGPKGPLWEDISSGMRRLGYNRSSKRCKEKWENINKYYKKVKESNKKRPEDSKTCPYFHQLEAIYSRKHLRSGAAASASNVAIAAAPPALPEQPKPSRHEIEGKNINDGKRNNEGSGGGAPQVPTSNGDKAPTTTPAALDADSGMKKPEDIVRELNEQPPREFTTDETDSDDMGDEYTDDGEEGEEDGKMQYRIQFQRPNPSGGTNTSPAPATTTTAAPAVPTSAPTSTFLAMVQ
ncbi:Trihelix transcription factor GTL1 [Dichanthelium oligosanthes]|uniref:Trihelix transcription factor GTL1 n=1 Tax=Dichanthelium oligosanthes TaxID=888268 RepID=A0A1E5V1S7_9POAL|nr:Trihelix transcription factor GTL1 [Dichanthelium oligosanthes]